MMGRSVLSVGRVCGTRAACFCDGKVVGTRKEGGDVGGAKSTVLLLHDGQPRTFFYAKHFIAQSAHRYYKLPLRLTTFFADSFWPLSKKAQFCVSDYVHSEILEKTVERISKQLEGTLNELLPEFGPFSCKYAFLYDEPSIEQQMNRITSEVTNRVVLLPLYAHYSCFRSGNLLKAAVEWLCARTVALRDGGREVPSMRAVPMSPVSFAVSTVDRWSAHPTLANYWHQLIQNRLKDYDSILFVAPQMRGYASREYSREVWSTCERISERVGNSVAWRLAWYGGWEQWPASSVDCIPMQLFFLRRERKERTLAIPVTSIFPTFDTETLLPYLLLNKGVDFVSPANVSPVLIHGLAEVLKNHLLKGRLASAQLSMRCRFCVESNCSVTKRILASQELSSSFLLPSGNGTHVALSTSDKPPSQTTH